MTSLPPWLSVTLVAFVAVGLVVPTVAVSIEGETGSSVDTTEHLELAPSHSSNGQYATVENGELELELSNLNDRARTTAHDVFTVTSTSGDLESVWFDADRDLEGVTLYEGDDPDAAITESNPLELSAGETTSIGVAVDTLEENPSSGSVTVLVELVSEDGTGGDSSGTPDDATDVDEPQSQIELVDVTFSATDLTVGETLVVNATYENRGDAAGEVTAQLMVDGIVVDGRPIALEAGETRTVTFERPVERSGSFRVGVDDRPPETVMASVSAADEPTANVTMSDVDLDADRIAPGETVNASATFENGGNATGNVTAELAIGGVVVDTERVDLEPGETRTVVFEWRFDERGTHEIAINGVVAGEVTVGDPSVFAVGSRIFHSSTIAAVALPMAIGVLFVASVVNRRRDLWP